MFRTPIKISDITNKLPDIFKRLRENEAMIWMENHRLKYMVGGSDTVYEASGITILDSSKKKIPVTADKVFKITGNYIKKSTVTETASEVRLDIELSLEGDAILDIMPLATDVNYGITLLENSLDSKDFTKATTSWMMHHNKEWIKQHSNFRKIYSSKPAIPLYGDSYYDSASGESFIYNKFLQVARIFGKYIKGERTFAILYADSSFKEKLNTLPITINASDTAYRLNAASIDDVDAFMISHGIPSKYVDSVAFYTMQSGSGFETDVENGFIYISDWEPLIGSLQYQIEQMSKASWQTL